MQADIVFETLRKCSDFYAHGQPLNRLVVRPALAVGGRAGRPGSSARHPQPAWTALEAHTGLLVNRELYRRLAGPTAYQVRPGG
jgi:hypothetical protein